MEIYIGIFDQDEVYARRLMAGLLKQADIKCHTVEFTKCEKIKAFAESHVLEFVLISREAYVPELVCERIGKIIVLCEARISVEDEAWAEEQGVSLLFKYQSIQILRREIFGSGKRSESEISEKQMIAVYSPIHRCGKTIFSLAVAQILSESKPVLFIGMDEFSVIASFLKNAKYDVMDAMYYLLQGEIKDKEKQLILSWGSIDMISPSRGADDIRNIKAEEFLELAEYFIKDSIYSAIVVDVGDLSDVAHILPKFDSVYLPVLAGEYNDTKKRAFREYFTGKGALMNERIKEVELPLTEWEDVVRDEGLELPEEYRILVRRYIKQEG